MKNQLATTLLYVIFIYNVSVILFENLVSTELSKKSCKKKLKK